MLSQNLVNFSCLSHFTKPSIPFPLTFYLFVFILLVTQFLCNLNSSCGFPSGSAGKESACNAGDLGSLTRLERSPGEGEGYPIQYSGLENSMYYVVHGIKKSWTQLSDFHFHVLNFKLYMSIAGVLERTQLSSVWFSHLVMSDSL